jgi:hypothetical protein
MCPRPERHPYKVPSLPVRSGAFCPIPGPWAATDRTGVTFSAPFCNIGSFRKSVELLPDFIQGFVGTQVTS